MPSHWYDNSRNIDSSLTLAHGHQSSRKLKPMLWQGHICTLCFKYCLPVKHIQFNIRTYFVISATAFVRSEEIHNHICQLTSVHIAWIVRQWSRLSLMLLQALLVFVSLQKQCTVPYYPPSYLAGSGAGFEAKNVFHSAVYQMLSTVL